VFDHASPIGEIVVASPTYMRWQADFAGVAAHAGLHPEEGRSAILAAAKAIVAIPGGRIDDETTVNVARIRGGVAGTNVVPERCTVVGEARSLSDAALEQVMADIVDELHDAANDPACSCDLDITVERLFEGYRRKTASPPVQAAEAALRERGYSPRRILSGGGSDANAFQVAGLECVNLANGTERAHQPGERVSQAALEGMLDVTYALLDELGGG
jgi:tripeptide aminopeptidase